MSFTMVPLTGTFETPAGTPASGTITLTPDSPMENAGMVATVPVVLTLVSGAIPSGAEIAATDDVGTTPSGVTYTVEIAIQGAPTVIGTLAVPASAGSIDLATAVVFPPPV